MSKNGAVLVTGGAGYVGSHAVVDLLGNGYEVVVVDNLVNSFKADETWVVDCVLPTQITPRWIQIYMLLCKNESLPESLKRIEKLTGKKVKFYEENLLNKEALSNIFDENKISCVIHFAALKAVSESCQIPLVYYSNNITGSISLLEVMKAHGVTKLVYSSSSTVYGTPQFLPLTEDHPTGQGCTNPYGKSKYFVEEILKDLCASDKSWNVISLRYFNPVGAHESGIIGEDPAGIPNNLMPYIAQVAIGRRPQLQVFGGDYDTHDGTGVRDYIHILDLAAGHISALKKLEEPGFSGFKAYNLGTGKGNSVLEVVAAFKKASGQEIKYKIVGRREGDIATSYCDTTLAKKELGWEAKKNLDDMCVDMWRWQHKNPNGFEGSL